MSITRPASETTAWDSNCAVSANMLMTRTLDDVAIETLLAGRRRRSNTELTTRW